MSPGDNVFPFFFFFFFFGSEEDEEDDDEDEEEEEEEDESWRASGSEEFLMIGSRKDSRACFDIFARWREFAIVSTSRPWTM